MDEKINLRTIVERYRKTCRDPVQLLVKRVDIMILNGIVKEMKIKDTTELCTA